jgi:recombinational DNA repair ATPase RecF
MLTSFAVDGFKSLQHVEVPLGLVNVFIGANGSGKSNLLEALGFLSASTQGRVDDQNLARRGVRLSVPRLYRASFGADSGAGPIALRTTYAADGNGLR